MILKKPQWNQTRPWQTNAALIAIGYGLIRYTQQLLVESNHYVIGDSGCSSASRRLSGLALTSTMRAWPVSSKWDSLLIGLRLAGKMQVPPLRFASVGMTN